jgi:tripartite-type tricarboxylate transporter receptor subunit TctC
MLTLTAVIAVVAAIATPTWAQDNFPTKPIRTVVPFEAGGDSDLEARLAGEYLEKILGQPMNLTFMPGGANIPGVMEVLKAAADGYTLLWWATPAIAINPVRKPGPYSAEDLQPIATTTDNPVMLREERFADYRPEHFSGGSAVQ